MNFDRFKTCRDKFQRRRVLVIGDLMIDEYLWGDVDRVSPEAPVPVVSINSEDYTLGGAGNVVNNLSALGADVSVVGVVGTGPGGRLLLDKFREKGVNTEGIIAEAGRPTTRKTRVIAANQHVLRIDRETRLPVSEDTLEKLTTFVEERIEAFDIIIISDYDKGLLTPGLLSRLIAAARKHGKITAVDPKGLDYSKYAGATILTPNRKEAALASGTEITGTETLLAAGEKIRGELGLHELLVTCGKDGMVLLKKEAEPFRIHSKARQVFDVSGAGDTVISVLGLALASGLSTEEAASLANVAGGIVVGKVGTATVTWEEIGAALAPVGETGTVKLKSLDELGRISREMKKKGKKIVLTNGCFDLLHAGHIQLFEASRAMGDLLIVAMDDDGAIESLKGAGRPVIKEEERVRILGALNSVDYLTLFSEGELNTLIETLAPDILTKGSNYDQTGVKGRDLVEKHGGRVELIPVTGNHSATDIICNIKKA